MKKTNISLFAIFTLAAAFVLTALSGCKFNLADQKYLKRPDVEVTDSKDGFRISGTYISTDIKYINIYRQEKGKNDVIRIAVLFPEGDPSPDNQGYFYEDKKILKNHNYRYYVRFTTKDGEQNRTDWTDYKITKDGGFDSGTSFAYTIGTSYYKYDDANHLLIIPDGVADFTAPSASVISDIAQYKPALVFQQGDNIRVFELASPNTTRNVSLKELLPPDFLNTPIKLLGIIGQKSVYNSAKTPVLQSITWTELAAITLKNSNNIKIDNATFTVNIQYGTSEGYDYSTKSDNEH